MNNISFAITVCDEVDELEKLLEDVEFCCKPGDEVVVQCDQDKVTVDVIELLDSYNGSMIEDTVPLRYHLFPLDDDFASFKNNLKKECYKQWIFQIDADERLQDGLIEGLHELLELNENVEAMQVPRINIVDYITQDHLRKWGWNYKTSPNFTHIEQFTTDNQRYRFYKHARLIKNILHEGEVEGVDKITIEYYLPIINYPDYQTRIIKNVPRIKWQNKVHEVVMSTNGHLISGFIPAEEDWCLRHWKDVRKQEEQNKFYDTI